MPDKPAAEISIDEALVRHLLVTQASAVMDAAMSPLQHVDEGWDCSIWRLGDELAVRLPRRRIAAALVDNEQRFLPAIAARLTGVGVPAAVFAGRGDAAYPWPWSIVPWFDGLPGLAVARSVRSEWARPLARALWALHTPAGADFPVNPFRGVPLTVRNHSIQQRIASLDPSPRMRDLKRIWDAGIAAPAWDGPAVWVHGDLHPGNVIARGGDLIAIIDFGDLTAGDPAYDLAIAWLAFDSAGRRVFRSVAVGYDDATWTRAHAWAAATTAMLLRHSDDNPAYFALGEECLAELTR